ncbi:hypothetical protein PWT90_04147 [Aphanocladium album]|nr:hypothetical protein PWT90_04147 [Aphanocladium album]
MSPPSPHPLLASFLPVSPDSKLLFWNGRASNGLTEEHTQYILEHARSGDFDLGAGLDTETNALRILAQVIDPQTGDSVLHIASGFSGEPLAVQEVLAQTYQRTCGLDRTKVPRQCALETIILHQNNAGDSALHVAARSGQQKAARYLYRLFCNHESSKYLDMVGESCLAESEHRADLDPEFAEARLALLVLPNAVGETAADAARASGHADMAAWLDNIVPLLDPDGAFTCDDIPRVTEEHFWGCGYSYEAN